jgi:hypothetical protein
MVLPKVTVVGVRVGCQTEACAWEALGRVHEFRHNGLGRASARPLFTVPSIAGGRLGCRKPAPSSQPVVDYFSLICTSGDAPGGNQGRREEPRGCQP